MKIYQQYDWLHEHYIDKKLSLAKCATIANTDAMTIRYWLLKNGIPTRRVGEHMKNGHSWRKGVPLSIETKNKIGKANYGTTRSIASRKKQSQSMRGKNNHQYGKQTHGKGHWVILREGETTIYMRSLWEIMFADWLIINNKKWEYEPKTFVLTNGMAYTPDFLVENIYYEIKGLLTSSQKAKLHMFVTEYPYITLKILYKNDLLSMGIPVNKRTYRPAGFTIVAKRTKICPTCNQTFVAPRRSSIYCCPECQNACLRKQRKPHVFLCCPICGTIVELFPSDLKHRSTCSIKCGRILGATKRSGVNHWSYKQTNQLTIALAKRKEEK
jgi:hypothetical protein